MLHFLIFKTSLDSSGLGFLECEPEVSRCARLRLGACPPQEGKQQQQLRSSAGQLLTCCLATVEQLLVLCGTSVEQLNALVTELSVWM